MNYSQFKASLYVALPPNFLAQISRMEAAQWMFKLLLLYVDRSSFLMPPTAVRGIAISASVCMYTSVS